MKVEVEVEVGNTLVDTFPSMNYGQLNIKGYVIQILNVNNS